MKNLMIGLIVVGAVGVAAAQEKGFALPAASPGQVTTERPRSNQTTEAKATRCSAQCSPLGVSRLEARIDSADAHRSVQPAEILGPGNRFLWRNTHSDGNFRAVDSRNFVPLASYYAPYYSPYSDYRNDDYYRMPNFSIEWDSLAPMSRSTCLKGKCGRMSDLEDLWRSGRTRADSAARLRRTPKQVWIFTSAIRSQVLLKCAGCSAYQISSTCQVRSSMA